MREVNPRPSSRSPILAACLLIAACQGSDGADGQAGQAGSSCSVMASSPGEITISCTDGTEATLQAYTDGQAVAAMGAKGPGNPLFHDRYTDDEAVAAVEAAGYVHDDDLQPVIDDVAEMRSCPVDMVDAGQFCIEIDERPPNIDIAQAGRICRFAGRRLCTFAEWNYACTDIDGLNDIIGNFEGSADMYIAGSLVSLGSGAASCGNVDAQSGPVAYRCCRSKF